MNKIVKKVFDNDKFLVSRKYEDETCNIIEANRVGRVVIRASR